MATWFECGFKYNKENEQGGVTTVSECYLVDAVSFTDAEERVHSEIGANYREFALLKVAKYPLHELVYNEGAIKWYKCKVALITLDEKSGKEKKQKQTILVSGNNIKEAYDCVEGLFSDSVSDYEIMDIVSTNIVEVLPYVEEERKLRKLESPVNIESSPVYGIQAEAVTQTEVVAVEEEAATDVVTGIEAVAVKEEAGTEEVAGGIAAAMVDEETGELITSEYNKE